MRNQAVAITVSATQVGHDTTNSIRHPEHGLVTSDQVIDLEGRGDQALTPKVVKHLAIPIVVSRTTRLEDYAAYSETGKLQEQHLQGQPTTTLGPPHSRMRRGHHHKMLNGARCDHLGDPALPTRALIPPMQLDLASKQETSYGLSDRLKLQILCDGRRHDVGAGVERRIGPGLVNPRGQLHNTPFVRARPPAPPGGCEPVVHKYEVQR